MQEKVNKFSNIKERIMYFLEIEHIKKVDFFDKVGITSANFRGNAQKTPLNSTAIENIITLYPQINLHWLITGNGDMLKGSDYESRTSSTNSPMLNESQEEYRSKNTHDTLVAAQIKTIEILEREVADLREDKIMLRDLIKTKAGKAQAS